MIHLIAKTLPNVNALNLLLGEPTQVLTFLEDAESVHTFWCVAIPYGNLVLKIILDSGAGYATYDEERTYISANTLQWHTIARTLLSHKNLQARKFGTLLVQSLPEIFKNLSTTTTPNGTLALRS